MKLCIVCTLAAVAALGSFLATRAGRSAGPGLMPEVVATAPLGDIAEVVVTAPGPDSPAGADLSMEPGAVLPESAVN